jgi:hypothetical protein
MFYLVWFQGMPRIERAHPVEAGFFRFKFRRDRRPMFARESPLVFYPKYLAETIRKQTQWFALYLRYYFILRRVLRDPKRLEYSDDAITPVTENDAENMEMFQSEEARSYLVKIQRVEKLRRGAAA